MDSVDNVDSLACIANEVAHCTKCPLHTGRVQAVPGEGPTNAKIMFIGEGPGYHEDKQGRPFVGQAGKFLDELLALAGLQRHDVFIGNVIKCRPPQNRDPEPNEIATCTNAYLFRQMAVINPSVIVTLGRFSMSLFLPGERITKIHGIPRMVQNRLIVPMMHPAAGLHQPKNRPLIEEDFRQLPRIVAEAEAKIAQHVVPSAQPNQHTADDMETHAHATHTTNPTPPDVQQLMF